MYRLKQIILSTTEIEHFLNVLCKVKAIYCKVNLSWVTVWPVLVLECIPCNIPIIAIVPNQRGAAALNQLQHIYKYKYKSDVLVSLQHLIE